MPVLLIHGNSSCKEVFRHQMESPLGEAFQLIAIDLPGHGASGRARDPKRTYSIPGYAETVVEVLSELGIRRAAVYGWSLGGHIGIDMIPRFPGMAGLMISGTPPVSPTPESLQAGFRPNPAGALLGQEVLSEDEIDRFAAAAYGANVEPALREAIARTDGLARRLMIESLFTGGTADQRHIVETSEVPIAIVDGELDPLVNLDYVAGLQVPELWEQHDFILRKAGHAAFFTHSNRFNPVLRRFLDDVATRSIKPSRRPSSSGVAAA